MIVELRRWMAKNVLTKEPVEIQQYRVFADGEFVGYMPWREGGVLQIVTRVDPIRRKEIEQQVAEMLERKQVISSMVPDVPPEMLEPQDEETEEFADDFE